MITVTVMPREISLNSYDLLEEFKSQPPGEQIKFLELLINHVYEYSADYHRAATTTWHGIDPNDWSECMKKLEEMLDADYSETDKLKVFIELSDVITSAKHIRK